MLVRMTAPSNHPHDDPDLGRLTEAIGLVVASAAIVGGTEYPVIRGAGVVALLGGAPPDGDDGAAAWQSRVHPADAEAYRIAVERMGGGLSADVEYRLVGYDGIVRTVWDRSRARLLADGTLVVDRFVLDLTGRRDEHDRRAVDLREDVGRLERALAESDRRSRIDALTGVYNRMHLAEVIESELGRGARQATTPGLFLIDLDHFKRVNDTFGHLPGDAVLVQAAARIRDAVRPYDCVARFGGEEFAVVVAAITDDAVLRTIGENLRQAIAAEPFEVDDALISLTGSVGCVRADRDTWTADALIAASDRALYHAKGAGRNRVHTAHDVDDTAPPMADAGIELIAEALAAAAAARERRPLEPARLAAELAGIASSALGLDLRATARASLAALLAHAGPVPLDPAERLSPVPDRVALADHALTTEDLVRRVAGLQEVAAVLRQQHERFDGTGVPDGLAGTDISIEARVVAVAVAAAVFGDDSLVAVPEGVLDPAVVAALQGAIAP